MKISISISDITKRIYALSAYRAVTAETTAAPAVLTRDNAPLLRRLIRDSFALTVAAIADKVTEFCELDPDDGGDILWLEASGISGAPGVVAESVAAAVLGRVLAAAWNGESDSLSEQYAAVADTALARLSPSTTDVPAIARPGRLRRHDF